MGVVEGPVDAGAQRAGTSSEADKPVPASSSGEKAGRSSSSGVPIRPFHTLSASVQERLSADLFEDPLLTPETMKELQDKMKWSYQFMRVSSDLCRVLYLLDIK